MIRFLILGMAMPVLFGACSGAEATGPPEINYGRDTCVECHMIISEARYASAYRDASGEPFVFDDIGGMLNRGADEGHLGEVTAWVHDYHDEEWIDAPDAWFVRGDIQTPMAGGVIAFASEGDASAFAADNAGTVMRWQELVTEAERGSFGTSTSIEPDQQVQELG